LLEISQFGLRKNKARKRIEKRVIYSKVEFEH